MKEFLKMIRRAKDDEREERINMEIIVDAYGPEEQAAAWYNYLSDTLQILFLPGVLLAARPRRWNREMKSRSWEWLQKRNVSMTCSC
jgi:hypothetical protein